MSAFDIATVKQAASGRWPEILSSLGGVSIDAFDGQHHPCPRCGGNDRFRLIDVDAGACLCNQCFSSKNGDGLAAIQWLTGKDFKWSLAAAAEHLGIRPAANGKAVDPAKHLDFLPWNPTIAGLWCLKKKPIKPEAIQAVGGCVARYRGQYTVIALPILGSDASEVGWILYRADGGSLPKYSGKGKAPEWVKVKITVGSKSGVITKTGVAPDGPVWKTEGPTDLLALLSANPDAAAFTTSCGACEKPLDWIVEQCRDRAVYVVHDADEPGQQGATWVPQRDGKRRPGWCPRLAEVSSDVRNVKLPFELQETHGSDLRDYFSSGYTFDDLVSLAGQAESFSAAATSTSSQVIEEHDDDPHRLARINIERYKSEHEGSLVFWRDEWWKWKGGKYRKIESSELRAKVWASVRAEFESCWHEKREKPVQKATRSLVANVIGAMESICILPSSIQMPCWLPDRSTPHYLAVKNGILDLPAAFDNRPLEECLLPHSPDWFSVFRLDYAFDPDAGCPKWLDYLQYVMEGDQERIDRLQEWAGYLLTGDNQYQRFLVLEGDGGNGKTVFFAAMTAMLGPENVSHVNIEDFGGQFGLGSTIGKAANISGDAGEIDRMAEGQLKMFTGGDVMQFDRKYLSPISAAPTAKLMAAWNSRPRLRDKSDGIWRRMLLVPFNRSVEESRRVYGMDWHGWWADEVSGILNWALIGLDRLQKNRGRFTESSICDDAVSEFREESNPVLEFFSDFLEVADGAIESNRLYELYSNWCKKNGMHPLGNKQFGKELRRKFPKMCRTRIRDGRKRFWQYEGINFSVDEIASEKVFEF